MIIFEVINKNKFYYKEFYVISHGVTRMNKNYRSNYENKTISTVIRKRPFINRNFECTKVVDVV